MSFQSEKIHKIMHFSDGLGILHVFAAPLGQQLLSHQEDKVLHVRVLSQLNALLGKLQAHLDFVKHWPQHRKHENLFCFKLLSVLSILVLNLFISGLCLFLELLLLFQDFLLHGFLSLLLIKLLSFLLISSSIVLLLLNLEKLSFALLFLHLL